MMTRNQHDSRGTRSPGRDDGYEKQRNYRETKRQRDMMIMTRNKTFPGARRPRNHQDVMMMTRNKTFPGTRRPRNHQDVMMMTRYKANLNRR